LFISDFFLLLVCREGAEDGSGYIVDRVLDRLYLGAGVLADVRALALAASAE